MEHNNNKGIRMFIKSYWQILVFIGGMIVAMVTAWTLVQANITNHSQRIEKVEIKMQDIEIIKGDIKAINVNIENIKEILKNRREN